VRTSSSCAPTYADTAPFTNPANMIATAAASAHVDTVVVDGRILKRHGRLTAVDPRLVVREAQESLDALLKRAGTATG
jgi:5-methylthioadenosine/S-adenosylhomocysteine deaminase